MDTETEDSRMKRILEQGALEYTTRRNKAVEAQIVESVEKHLGRVPSNQEIASHSLRKVYPDGSEQYFWDDVLLFEVTGMGIDFAADGMVYLEFHIRKPV